MATYGFGGCEYHCARLSERQRQEWGRSYSDGTGVVRIRSANYCDDWITGYDSEYSGSARFGGLMRWAEKKGIVSCSSCRRLGEGALRDIFNRKRQIPICQIFSVHMGGMLCVLCHPGFGNLVYTYPSILGVSDLVAIVGKGQGYE